MENQWLLSRSAHPLGLGLDELCFHHNRDTGYYSSFIDEESSGREKEIVVKTCYPSRSTHALHATDINVPYKTW